MCIRDRKYSKLLARAKELGGIKTEGSPFTAVSYTHLRAHETDSYLVCRLLLEKKRKRLEKEGPKEEEPKEKAMNTSTPLSLEAITNPDKE